MTRDEEADAIAEAFHYAYEQLAPRNNYKTRKASAVPWKDVPAANKATMRATARALLDAGVIKVGKVTPGNISPELMRIIAEIETF